MKPRAVANSAAGVPHPDDPSVFITQVSVVDSSGISTSGARSYERVGGLVMSETVTNGNGAFKKTYTRDGNGDIVSETDWVKQ